MTMTTKRKTKTDEKQTEEKIIVSYKGFDKDFRCRGFQFEVGKTYEHSGKVEACASGFHACEHPLNVFRYYPPATSRYALVRQGGEIARHDDDTKIASGKITIEGELRIPDLVAAAVKWVFDRAKWPEGPVATEANGGATASGDQGAATASGRWGAATASGDQGAATASGRWGAATASGYQGAATASGYQGAATASGDQGAATASGYQGAATASGDQGAATASGYQGKAQAKEGSAIFLVERNDSYEIVAVWAGIAGTGGIKPGTFYRLVDGKPEEVT